MAGVTQRLTLLYLSYHSLYGGDHLTKLELLIGLHTARTASIETTRTPSKKPLHELQEELLWQSLKAQKAHPMGYTIFEIRYLRFSPSSYQLLAKYIHSQLKQGTPPNEIEDQLQSELESFETHLQNQVPVF